MDFYLKEKRKVIKVIVFGVGGIDAMTGNLLDLDKKGGETFGGEEEFLVVF